MAQYYKVCYRAKKLYKWKCFDPMDVNFPKRAGGKLVEQFHIGNPLIAEIVNKIYYYPMQVIWAGDYADDYEGVNLYDAIFNPDEYRGYDYDEKKYRYLLNHDKRVFIDLSKIKEDKRYGYRIHPLPLLTAIGNGRGGGDYHGTCMDAVGSWVGDFVEIRSSKPNDEYVEVEYSFVENW